MTGEKAINQTINSLTFHKSDALDIYTAGDTAREIIEHSIGIIECAKESAMNYENTRHIIDALAVAVEGLENALELTEYIRQEWFKMSAEEGLTDEE